jgi:hypothetical protein
MSHPRTVAVLETHMKENSPTHDRIVLGGDRAERVMILSHGIA